MGSIDFFAVARSVLLVGRVEGEANIRAVVQIKNNLAAFGHPKAFELSEDGRKKQVYTDYDALERAMGEIRSFLEARDKNETVAFPYKIGCGSAGGDWSVVEDIIKRTFEGYSGEVQIWRYEE